jgi:AcrR family transcriptional regulator
MKALNVGFGKNRSDSPVSPTRSESRGKGGRYHHGDLRTALVDVAIDLIAERGLRRFSLAEGSRRLGVTVAAPYRHFADRDALLAAVAVRGLEVFADMVAHEVGEAESAEQRLAAMARAYVRFAAEQRPLFETLYSSGIDKRRYPELRRAYEPVDSFRSLVAEICEGDPEATDALAGSLEATAHGYAALLAHGEYGRGPKAVRAAADRAANATLALIQGSVALRTTVASSGRGSAVGVKLDE